MTETKQLNMLTHLIQEALSDATAPRAIEALAFAAQIIKSEGLNLYKLSLRPEGRLEFLEDALSAKQMTIDGLRRELAARKQERVA